MTTISFIIYLSGIFKFTLVSKCGNFLEICFTADSKVFSLKKEGLLAGSAHCYDDI